MGSVRIVLSLLLAVSLAACAGAAHRPVAPDDSVLRPAQSLAHKAEAAGAAELAPGALRDAYRHLDVARGLLYAAAVQRRDTTEAENTRIRRLVEEASVDARLALVKTQQEAVGRKLDEYKATTQEDKDTP